MVHLPCPLFVGGKIQLPHFGIWYSAQYFDIVSLQVSVGHCLIDLFSLSVSACLLACLPLSLSLCLSRCVHASAPRHRTSALYDKSRYYQVQNTQSDILDRVFLILWINAVNSCKTRRLPVDHGR